MWLVNTSGSVIRTYNNDAFGNSLLNSGSGAVTPFRYNGQYTDSETGLIYLRNRYYDPSIGRFTQEDTYWNVNNMIYGEDGRPSYPAIAQSSNLYVYCMNDPVNLSDLFGMEAGDHFGSLEEAIADWAWNNCGYTIVTGNEKGGALYYGYEENGEVYYSYTWTDYGKEHQTDVKKYQNDRPDGTEILGYIHTHYEYDYLSQSDIDLAKSTGKSVYMVYVKDGKGKVDVCRKTRYGYRIVTDVYEITGYAPWTYWGGIVY